ncbi:hypothetical protein [Mycobacterium pseudokansasii]|uniref:hypothetical protein n=1 Tax=Mycobacterium pseudokansasii TaxID=2341080 RepID=UPI000C06FF3D|nr:hypothetical protein [Mycobacterium pseudokansasii]
MIGDNPATQGGLQRSVSAVAVNWAKSYGDGERAQEQAIRNNKEGDIVMTGIRVLEVTYEIDAQNNERSQFSVPKPVCRLLGVGPMDNVWVEVTSASGGVTSGATKLKSGTEIYGDGFERCCEPKERIRVRVRVKQSAQ